MTILEDAHALGSMGPLCDSCLGRPVADRSHGLRNAERGRALRVVVALDDDEAFDPPDPGDCWVCEGQAARFDEYAERAADTLTDVELHTYQVGTRVPPLVEENDRLLREEAGLSVDVGEAFNTECNREVGRRLGALLDATVDFKRPDVQVLIDLEGDEISAQINSLALYGRYRKLERGIPQTEWDKYDKSVEELVAPPALSTFRGTGAVFHGAGREDVDALMLGTGRPFVLEIEEPRRRDADLSALEVEINDHADGKVEVEGLRMATHDMIERVKGLPASKTYRMDIEFGEPVPPDAFEAALAELEGTTVQQRTPNRVAHRRADHVRERQVYEIDGDIKDDRRATVTVHGEGGLYVKELVSGDEGHTRPSIADLVGAQAEVTALDVIAVEGEDEPFKDPNYLRDVEV